jgi:AmiR/NasT family two-component response regulator
VLLTRRQVAVKLGVSIYVVDALRRRGLLPTVKIAGRTMVPVSAVNEYVERNAFAFVRTNAKSASVPRQAQPVPPAVPVRRLGFSSVRGV